MTGNWTPSGKGDRADGLHHSRAGALALTRSALRLYPRAWRERYADEVLALLELHPVTLWTVLDVLLGAVDAHLRRDLLPERLTAMAHRIRTSEIAIFVAFVLFCLAWVPLRRVRDPLWVWQPAVEAHPWIGIAMDVVDLAGGVALLALVLGGLPLGASALIGATRARRWNVLLRFAFPVVAVVAVAVYTLLARPYWAQKQSSAPDALLTPLAVVLQLGFFLLLLFTAISGTVTIAGAISNSEVSERVLRFALLPGGVMAAAFVVGTVATCALLWLIATQAPELGVWPPFEAAIALLMLAAAVVAAVALRRGLGAARA